MDNLTDIHNHLNHCNLKTISPSKNFKNQNTWINYILTDDSAKNRLTDEISGQ